MRNRQNILRMFSALFRSLSVLMLMSDMGVFTKLINKWMKFDVFLCTQYMHMYKKLQIYCLLSQCEMDFLIVLTRSLYIYYI